MHPTGGPRLAAQVAELEVLRASCLAEEFRWRGTEEQASAWDRVCRGVVEDPDTAGPPLAFSFALRLREEPEVWLNVDLPDGLCDDDSQLPSLAVSGKELSKETWGGIDTELHRLRTELAEEDNLIFDLWLQLTRYVADLHLAEAPATEGATTHPEYGVQGSFHPIRLARCIFWSHHLKSTVKRKELAMWSSELSLWGVLKLGYPGYLIFEGREDDVAEMISRVKGMQWHALSLRSHQLWQATASAGDLLVEREALQSCPLARNHLRNRMVTSEHTVRTGVEEMDDMGELVKRLSDAGLPSEEIRDALGLRTKAP